MAYQLKAVTIRTDNSPKGLSCINEVWQDIFSGKLPVLSDSSQTVQADVSPVSKYSNYASDETGAYDLTIMAVTSGFFQELEEKTGRGLYRKYDTADENGDIARCTKSTWEKVWMEQKEGRICRTFVEDYECTVPGQFAKDKKAHCCLYIAI